MPVIQRDSMRYAVHIRGAYGHRKAQGKQPTYPVPASAPQGLEPVGEISPSQTASRACAAALIPPPEVAGQQVEEFAVGGRGPQGGPRQLLQKHGAGPPPAAADHRSQVAFHRRRGNPEFSGGLPVEPLRDQAEVLGIAPDALHHIGGGLEARQLPADAQGAQQALRVHAPAGAAVPLAGCLVIGQHF